MNGLEAVKVMMDGKRVYLANKPEIKYGISNGFIGIVDDRGCFVEETLFNYGLDYEEYIEPKPLTGWERVNESEDAYFISVYQGVDKETDWREVADIACYDIANYFSTREKAEEIDFKQTLFRKLQRFSDENGGNEIKLGQKVSTIFLDASGNLEILNVWSNRIFGNVVFASSEIAEKAIELFRDDLIKYFTNDFGGQS